MHWTNPRNLYKPNIYKEPMPRTESSSSINTFRQCPRKYYFAYKLKLPTKDSIATITGKAVHDSLEKFFKINLGEINHQKFEIEFEHFLVKEFHNNWVQAVPKLIELKIYKDKILDYYQDSIEMLNNFLKRFCSSMRIELAKYDFIHAFEKLRPLTEVYILSEKYNVHGYLDALYLHDDKIIIMDYKTSKKDEVSEQYKLQLAIYVLLAYEKFGKLPDKVGLYFLRQGSERFVEVTEELLRFAQREAELIHVNTESNHIKDYAKCPGPLCNWCDFYDECFGQQKLNSFEK